MKFVFVDSEEKIFLEKLGQRITKIREEQNLSKVQLAFEINTGEAAIRRIEKGQVNPGILMLKKISIALNVELGELIDL